jgi:serine/threonine protein phosphatase PrpC
MRLETAMRFGAPVDGGRPLPPEFRPEDDELDLFGLTHPGRVREENQDHFLLCTVHPQVVVHGTSLPDPEGLALRGGRLATMLLVADGVGGSAAGSLASRLATEAVTRYLASSLRRYHTAGTPDEAELMAELRAAALAAHETVRAESETKLDGRTMATTLSLGVVVWPWIYVLQVGDSRCYFFEDGRLRQVTRDQTVAQDLVERGVLSRERAHASPLSHVLSSAIGASEALPVVTRVDGRYRGSILLFCTDGLTKHVSDAEIGAHLAAMTSSEQVCRALVALALERGGTDNVTVVVARARRRSGR